MDKDQAKAHRVKRRREILQEIRAEAAEDAGKRSKLSGAFRRSLRVVLRR